jgi:nucleoside-diphosphate-sugar epimerase
MKILITGNMGYIGPVLLKTLRQNIRDSFLIGFDSGFFAHCLSTTLNLPEVRADVQHFGDIRSFQPSLLTGVDAVVHLAAISNDPMGAKFEKVTYDVNFKGSLLLAKQALECGVKRFVFASSCSMYGSADGRARNEEDDLRPLTAYARSKADFEAELSQLTLSGGAITSLRFATACGMSERLRLDLVLNDFVACAVTAKKITVLSDGTPWRPLIDVKDMCRAILWGLTRAEDEGGSYVAVNVGSEDRNYQVKDLAVAVANAVPGTTVSINPTAQQDKRSYRVDFSKFKRLAPKFQPRVSLMQTIYELVEGMTEINFSDNNFRDSEFIRLRVLERLTNNKQLNSELYWIQ